MIAVQDIPFIHVHTRIRGMNRIQRLAILSALIILSTPLYTGVIHQARATSTTFIDPDLARAISSGASQVKFVITYDHTPTSSDRAYLNNLGLAALFILHQLPMALAVGTPAQAQAIANQQGIVSLWNDTPQAYYGQVTTTNHNYGTVPISNSWWLDTMNVRPAWNQGFKGQGIGVAIVDSGVDATNPDLGYSFTPAATSPVPPPPKAPYRVIQNVKVLSGCELVGSGPCGDQIYLENQPDSDTTGGHGTGTSSSAAGTGGAAAGSPPIYMGVAPQANIIGLGAGDTIAIFFAISSFDYILQHHVDYNIRVNSNSWGPASSCDTCFTQNDPINVATKAMHDAGITVLFSAGNSGKGDATISGYAVQPWVIGVGASQISKGLTGFSSRGFSNNSSRWPTIVAPGENLIAAKALTGGSDNSLNTAQDSGNIIAAYLPYYTTFGGTSGASPLTAGAVAVLLSANPSLNPDQVKSTLTATADPMPGYLAFQVGAGHVNTARAVHAALTGSFTPGTVTIQNRGIQAYNLKAFEALGLEIPLASTPVDNNFPTFTGAQYFNVTVSWQRPSSALGWNVRLISPNDKYVVRTPLPGGVIGLNGIYSTAGSTSVGFSVAGASLITSYYNAGQSMGTWDVQVFNTQTAETYQVNVQVHYAQSGHMQMGDGNNDNGSRDIKTDESGTADVSGNTEAIFQGYDGTVQGTQILGIATVGTPLSISTTLHQPQGQVVQVVQLVIVDSNGNVVQWLDGWVTTQSDIQTRITQIQTALLTASPSQAVQLQAELAQLNTALTTAPTIETLPSI